MSHPSWIFNESPIFASSFSQRAPRRQHGDELSSLSFLLCTFPIHYPKYMLYIICSLCTFPKKYILSLYIQELQGPKTGEERMQSPSPDDFGFVVVLFACLSKKTWKLDCGVQRSRKVADWAFTRLSEDFKRVLDVSPRKCHKPVHCCFHRKMPAARQLVILGKKRKTG